MHPFKVSLLVTFGGWLLGFLALVPMALLKGRLSSHEFLVGEVQVEQWDPNRSEWRTLRPQGSRSEWRTLRPQGSVTIQTGYKSQPPPSEGVRLVFIGELVRLYDPRPSLDAILFSSDGTKNCRWCRYHDWFGIVFMSRYEPSLRTDPVQSMLSTSIHDLLERENLPNEICVASMLLASLDQASAPHARAAIAVEFGAQPQPMSLGTQWGHEKEEFAFHAPDQVETEWLRIAAKRALVDDRLTPPPSIWPARLNPGSYPERPYEPRPTVLTWEELRSNNPPCYMSGWASVFRAGTASSYAKVGWITAVLSLLGYWGYRWRGGFARMVRSSASGVSSQMSSMSSQMSSIDKFMSDPAPHEKPPSQQSDDAQ